MSSQRGDGDAEGDGDADSDACIIAMVPCNMASCVAILQWQSSPMKRAFFFALQVAAMLVPAGPSVAAEATPAADAAAEVQPARPDEWTMRPSVMSGLGQWVIFGGGNLAAQLKVGRFVVEYSHGQALDYDRLGGFAKSSADRDADLSVFSPWTTGGGMGFQITPALHVLVEMKAHRYEVKGRGDELRYTTFSIGPGIFYDLYLYKGLFVQPSLRFWPNVASTLDDGSTLRRQDGTPARHEAHAIGFFMNVNVGWTFSGV